MNSKQATNETAGDSKPNRRD